jgi:hypothetical protein
MHVIQTLRSDAASYPDGVEIVTGEGGNTFKTVQLSGSQPFILKQSDSAAVETSLM